MAASNTNVIRVRLYFDYPPPSVSDCRMCWVLVDLNKCRVVADIASVIREKFDFSRRSILSLFIEDCYLPHTESIYVVRDNDSIRCVTNPRLARHVFIQSDPRLALDLRWRLGQELMALQLSLGFQSVILPTWLVNSIYLGWLYRLAS